jgi:hypothetical protein
MKSGEGNKFAQGFSTAENRKRFIVILRALIELVELSFGLENRFPCVFLLQ